MTNKKIQFIQTTEKFTNADQIWFWFLYTKSVRTEFRKTDKNSNGGRRVCELIDVETLITKLYLSGKLTDEQLSVMKEFGDKRRSPNQHIWAENKAAANWRNAMKTINIAATAKGWIE